MQHTLHVQDDMDAVCGQLLNQLVLLAPPGFIYAATPPAAAGRAAKAGRQRRGQLGGGGAAAVEDEEQATVYGSYAAVTLCDCRWASALTRTMHQPGVGLGCEQ